MTWFWLSSAITFFLLLDALRLRVRARALPVLAPSDALPHTDHRFLAHPGLDLDDATRRAASAHVATQGLDVLDLVPSDMPALGALRFLRMIEPAGYRRNPFGPGRSAGNALVVTADMLARARVPDALPADAVELVRLVKRLKHYACKTTDVAVARDLTAAPEDPRRALALIREIFGYAAPIALLAPALVLTLLALSLVWGSWAGITALAAFHLQPLVALGGTVLKPRDLGMVTLLRAPIDLVRWVRTILCLREPAPRVVQVATLRPTYQKLLESGVDRFFEPRRTRCPLCGSGDLEVHLTTGDLLQHKPGIFTLEWCRGCRHIFQNPRLSIEGLDFYYRDFYDGLGEAGYEFIFGAQREIYVARAQIFAASPQPARWLDVGCGHGHFCCVAREVLPRTRFDGLDLSESVEEAARRGWIDRGFRGLFPEVAPQMAGAYDVVSMSHYLEHTLDLRAELAAAREALRPGGRLFIEVPDPDCPLGEWFGPYWVPYFQPQHLHLVSTANIDRLLREQGFTPETWHRGPAHIECDFFVGLALLLGHLAPPDLPWRPILSLPERALRGVVWTVGLPLLFLARQSDRLTGALVRRFDKANAYRVVARRES
jgi:SAM-dependent methyltransferase